MLKRIDELFKLKVDFAFETTLASKTYKEKVLYAQANGYKVTLLFLWLNSVELAVERVQSRVSKGGHNIPEDTIKRRYKSGLINLFKIYLPLVNDFMIVDNSDTDYFIIAEGSKNEEITINDLSKWGKLKA